jgi:hypothetical protein
MSKTVWRGDTEVKRRMMQYGRDVKGAVKSIAENYAARIEADAKKNAPWDDRTTNARQGLFSQVEQDSESTTIYLSHLMDYGVYLELKFQGRYAIILPTLESYYPQIQGSIKELMG